MLKNNLPLLSSYSKEGNVFLAYIMRNSKVTRKLMTNCIFNPLTPMCDQDRISPYNINTILSRQVMRINKNTN